MDKQLEHRIRERAYELWMQNGSLPGRAEEYWLQAEQEILGSRAQGTEDAVGGITGDVGSYPASEDEGQALGSEGREETMDVSPAPLGMTSETMDEMQVAPTPAKTRKRRSSAVASSNEGSDAMSTTPKRKRSVRTP